MPMKILENTFESLLWNSRFIVITAVIVSLLSGLALFYMASVDAFYMLKHLFHYASPALDAEVRKILHDETITHVVEIVDGYLLATVLLIFGMGLYELFISKIEAAQDAETSSNVLLINNLDDLKNRLAKVILMILIVNFFEHVISMDFNTAKELLYLAGGIALIGLALYLSHSSEHKHALSTTGPASPPGDH
jgi:uncharacterized membrane protein YqhA